MIIIFLFIVYIKLKIHVLKLSKYVQVRSNPLRDLIKMVKL